MEYVIDKLLKIMVWMDFLIKKLIGNIILNDIIKM